MEVTLTLPAIHCEGCIATVKSGLTRVPGVGGVRGDARRKQVTVSLDETQTSLGSVKSALASLGFPPREEGRACC